MGRENLNAGEEGVTAVQFESLLQRLDPDRDLAGEKYEKLRQKLMKFFQWNNCSDEDDLADETLDRVARKIGSLEIRDLAAFIWGVAKNVVREAGRKPPMRDLNGLPPEMEPHTGHPEIPIIDKAENERRLGCLQQCVQRLSAADRELFLDYEYYVGQKGKTQALAERSQLSVRALRSKAHRLKAKVEKCTLRCFRLGAILKLSVTREGEPRHDE